MLLSDLSRKETTEVGFFLVSVLLDIKIFIENMYSYSTIGICCKFRRKCEKRGVGMVVRVIDNGCREFWPTGVLTTPFLWVNTQPPLVN